MIGHGLNIVSTVPVRIGKMADLGTEIRAWHSRLSPVWRR